MNLERILHWTVVAGVFILPFVPLLVAHSLFFPFITGKNFTFRIVVEVIAGAWLMLALINKDYRPKRSWLLIAFAAFVTLIAISNVLGAYPAKSFWSNYERMEGWFTLLHLLAYFVVATAVMKSELLWKRLFQTSLGVSLIIVLYGLFQLGGFITINQGGIRLDATLGNASYLAIYMLFHIFIAGLLLGQAWAEERKRIWYGSVYGLIIFLQTIILFFTATRGAILGLIGGVFLSALLLIVMARNSKHAWRASVGVAAGIILLFGGFVAIKDTQFVQQVEPLRRLAEISISEVSSQARFLNWNMAWQGVMERPLLGWGQENYNIVFNQNYDPRMYAQEQWFDRVHNIILDWLIAGGFLGLAAYLSIFLIALYYLWFSGVFLIPEKAVLTGVLAGYGFHNLFVFDNIVSYILFVTILSYIVVRVLREKSVGDIVPSSMGEIRGRMVPVASVLVLALTLLSVWGMNWNAYAANRALLSALGPQTAGITGNLEAFKAALAYRSLGTQEMREQLVQITSRISQNPNIPQEVKQEFLQLSRDEMNLQMEASPEDARHPLFLGTTLDAYGLHVEAQPVLEKALSLSPNKQTIMFQLGFNAINRGDLPRALEIFETAFNLEPDFRDARLFYAYGLILTDNIAKADEVLEPLITIGRASDQRVISALASKGEFQRIIRIWEAHLVARPNDVQAQFALSAAYYSAGDQARALEILEQAAVANPAVRAQAEELMEQIRNGTAVLQ